MQQQAQNKEQQVSCGCVANMYRCHSLALRRHRWQPRRFPECWSALSHPIERPEQPKEEEGRRYALAHSPSSSMPPQGFYSRQQSRQMSTWIPEILQGYTLWGGAGFLLKTLHMDGVVPYWACFSIINVLVRTMLFPLTLYSAHTAARFRPVAPEIQFFLSIYQNDFQHAKAHMTEHLGRVWRQGWESMKGIYKLNKVNPLAPFLSPLLQIPVFMYVSTDLRKIVNGRDPELAQELTDCGDHSLFWLTDLTEADPFFVLPIFAGLAMYANVETALGRRSLAGEATSKANTGVMLKDVFQSVAVFMPCFTAHFPAGMQVYLCTTFVFTAGQNYALRNDQFRQWVGLPSLQAPSPPPKLGTQMLELKRLEQQADRMRGDGPLLGRGVLYRGWRLSFAGSDRPSTIEPDATAPRVQDPQDDPVYSIVQYCHYKGSPQTQASPSGGAFVTGISASSEEMAQRQKEAALVQRIQAQMTALPQEEQPQRALTDEEMIELMEKANRGERPVLTEKVETTATNNNTGEAPKLLQKKRMGKGKKKKKGGKRRKR